MDFDYAGGGLGEATLCADGQQVADGRECQRKLRR
jgi:hypothetical protein